MRRSRRPSRTPSKRPLGSSSSSARKPNTPGVCGPRRPSQSNPRATRASHSPAPLGRASQPFRAPAVDPMPSRLKHCPVAGFLTLISRTQKQVSTANEGDRSGRLRGDDRPRCGQDVWPGEPAKLALSGPLRDVAFLAELARLRLVQLRMRRRVPPAPSRHRSSGHRNRGGPSGGTVGGGELGQRQRPRRRQCSGTVEAGLSPCPRRAS
jgi:hypothetical protein